MWRCHRAVFGLFLLSWLLNCYVAFSGFRLPADFRWVEWSFIHLAFLTTLLGLACRLPFQNVLMAAVLIAGISWGLLALNLKTGVPFGWVRYFPAAGPMLPGGVPMMLPLLWVVVLVNAGEVARAVAGLQSQSGFRGWWQLGIATALGLGFEMLHQRFATEVMGFWQWMEAGSPPQQVAPPWRNTLTWLVMMPMLRLLLLPWLIDKRPVPMRAQSGFDPLLVWLGLAGWMIAGLVKTDGRCAVFFLVWNVAAGGLVVAGARRDRAGT